MKIDCRLGNAKSIGNVLVAVTILNQLQYVDLARCEIFVIQMLCNPPSNLCRDILLSVMNGTYDG